MAEKKEKMTRRFFLGILGKLTIVGALLAETFGAIKVFIPRILYEPSSKFKVGRPENFPEGLTFLPENKLYIIRRGNDFHALSAVCTHLFCVVDWKPDSEEFYCSCHGSIFTKEGINMTGPAPKPLPWFSLALAPDGNLLVDSDEEVSSDEKFSL